jgi:hypothetical protein
MILKQICAAPHPRMELLYSFSTLATLLTYFNSHLQYHRLQISFFIYIMVAELSIIKNQCNWLKIQPYLQRQAIPRSITGN